MKASKMKLLVGIVVLMIVGAYPTFAQDFSRFELFGGYSAAWGGNLDSYKYNEDGFDIKASKWLDKGFALSGTYNFSELFGVETAIRYNSGDIFTIKHEYANVNGTVQTKIFSLGVGPKFSFKNDSPVTPFVHSLIGINHLSMNEIVSSNGEVSEDEDVSANGLSGTIGGGLDVKVNDRVAIRAIQADYAWGRHNGDNNNVVFSFGVVVGF